MEENSPVKAVAVTIREYDSDRDRRAAEFIDRICEVGPSGKVSLYTDLLGDPLSRIRNSPSSLMLVAETIGGPEKEIVGVVRGCLKTVSCGGGYKSFHTKLGYILGLRVSPSHRRMGIGVKLVKAMEEWFGSNGAEYSYMATDKENEASLKLFTTRCGYSKFRTPCVLVHPVFSGHRLPLSSRHRKIHIISVSPSDAAILYRSRFSSVEFFPSDIDAILNNHLSLGTYIAVPHQYRFSSMQAFISNPPESWTVMSLWNCKEVFKLQVCGVSAATRAIATMTRLADRAMPWLKLPSVPNLFKPFGFYFLYGIGGEGPKAVDMVRQLCRYAHNMARDGGCKVIVTEVASCQPLRIGVPHWRKLSCPEDLWCAKKLNNEDGDVSDWTKSPPGSSIFVDPREI